RRQLLLHAGESASPNDRERQQDKQYADSLDRELDDVGRRECPHASEHRVANHDGAAEQYRLCPRYADHDFRDRANGDGRDHDDHEIVAPPPIMMAARVPEYSNGPTDRPATRNCSWLIALRCVQKPTATMPTI